MKWQNEQIQGQQGRHAALVPPGVCSQPGFHKKLRSFALSPIDRPPSSRERREELREKIERYHKIDHARVLWSCGDYAFVAEAKAKTIELRHRTLELLKKVDASETLAIQELRKDIEEPRVDTSPKSLMPLATMAQNQIDTGATVYATAGVQNDTESEQLHLPILKPMETNGEVVGEEELARRKSKMRSIRSNMRQRLINREMDPAPEPTEKLLQKRMFDRNRSTSTLSSASSGMSTPLGRVALGDGPLMRLMTHTLSEECDDSGPEYSSEPQCNMVEKVDSENSQDEEEYVTPRHKKSLASLATGMNSIQEFAEAEDLDSPLLPPGAVQNFEHVESVVSEAQSLAASKRASSHVGEQRRASVACGDRRTSKVSFDRRLSRAKSRSSVQVLEQSSNLEAPPLRREQSSNLDGILYENTRDIANLFMAVAVSSKRGSLQERLSEHGRTGGVSVENREGKIRCLESWSPRADLTLEVEFPSTTRRKGERFERDFTNEELSEVFAWGLMCDKSSSERYSWLSSLVFIKRGAEQTSVGLKYFDESKTKGAQNAKSEQTNDDNGNQIASEVRDLFQSTRKRSSFWAVQEANPIASSRGLKDKVADVLHDWYDSMKGGFDCTNHSLIPFIRKIHRTIGRSEADHEQMMKILTQGRSSISPESGHFEQFLDWLVLLFPHVRNMNADDVRRFADLVERQVYDPEPDLDSFTEAISSL